MAALLSAWWLGGLYLDGWAHHHLSATLETFFTPWHAVFYAGFLALTAGIGRTALIAPPAPAMATGSV